jgi:2-C-methyl-D-erythritol 4-phosphate cytidylyltransferase
VPYEVVDGGGSRNESVRNALLRIDEADDARVLVHDGVRPLVSDALIASVAHRLLSSTCVIPVIPSADPLVVVRDGDVIGFEDRGDVYRGQSPQGFWLSSLRDAFLPQPLDQLSVFATIFEAVRAARGHLEIATVPGDMNNVKITTPVDRLIAGRLLLEDE